MSILWIEGDFILNFIILLFASIIIALIVYFLIYNVIKMLKEDIVPFLISLLLFIGFSIGGDIIINIIISIVFENFFINNLEMKYERKKTILKKKLNKYNRRVESTNIPEIHTLELNDEFYDIWNKYEKFYWKLFVYPCLNIPLVFWEIFIKITNTEEPNGNFLGLFNDYYEYKLLICLSVFFITFLICILIILNKKSEFYIIRKLCKKRRENIQVKNEINELINNRTIFTDDEKIFMGEFSLDEIKILNEDNIII